MRRFAQAASFIAANVIMALAPSTRTLSYAQFDQYKLSLLVLSITFVGNITTNNMSLVHIGLSVNQVRAPASA